jgi:SAM-dependent MidA family methyltransferase
MKVWEAMGRPATFNVVEMGAGNGTLAKDFLVWARENEPEFYDALRYNIVEYGDLIKNQQERISGSVKYPFL